ncbi:hypothetical protein NX059_012402 [Plenodomus lindquistii]|nr:hypothetical protein NX059_012402 [Plenodomus lindquistii]
MTNPSAPSAATATPPTDLPRHTLQLHEHPIHLLTIEETTLHRPPFASAAPSLPCATPSDLDFDQKVEIFHPGAKDRLFALARSDVWRDPRTNRLITGLATSTAMGFCSVVTGSNRGYLSKESDITIARTRKVTGPLLTDSKYYYYKDDIDPFYAVIPSMKHWTESEPDSTFTNQGWDNMQMDSRRDEGITDCKAEMHETKVVHTCMEPCFREPRPETLPPKNLKPNNLNKKSNKIRMEKPLLRPFIESKIVLLPKRPADTAGHSGYKLYVHVLSDLTSLHQIHNCQFLAPLVDPKSLFLRYVWTVFQCLKPFMMKGVERMVLVESQFPWKVQHHNMGQLMDPAPDHTIRQCCFFGRLSTGKRGAVARCKNCKNKPPGEGNGGPSTVSTSSRESRQDEEIGIQSEVVSATEHSPTETPVPVAIGSHDQRRGHENSTPSTPCHPPNSSLTAYQVVCGKRKGDETVEESQESESPTKKSKRNPWK